MVLPKNLLFFLIFSYGVLSAQAQPSELIICWDISLSMEDRVVEPEFAELEKIFRKQPNTTVKLLLFGVEVQSKSYSVVQGNWEEIKKELSELDYDGGTVYSVLNPYVQSQKVVVFTDGNQLLAKDSLQ